MPTWIWIIVVLFGVLFAIKCLFLMAIFCSLPKTRGALFVPTKKVMIKAFLDAVPMNPHHRFVDLGCGDGRILRAARKRYGVKALGFEINPMAYLIARLQSLRTKGIEIQRKSFWGVDLTGVDIVFCYLFPDILPLLAKKLLLEMLPGSRVVSCNFPFPGWSPLEVIASGATGQEDPIYVYAIPRTVA